MASLGVSQGLLRDDSVGSPSYPLKTLVGGEWAESVEGLLASHA